MATFGPGSVTVGIKNIANLKCCCPGCLCPDGFNFPSDYINVTISGLTGVAAVLNGTWTCVKDPTTSAYRYFDLIGGNRYSLTVTCNSGNSSTWFSAYAFSYGHNEGAGFTYDWTVQTGGNVITWDSGSDSCNPVFIDRTPTGEAWNYAVFVPFSVTTIYQTYSLTISR